MKYKLNYIMLSFCMMFTYANTVNTKTPTDMKHKRIRYCTGKVKEQTRRKMEIQS